jgi:hypothetical protein
MLRRTWSTASLFALLAVGSAAHAQNDQALEGSYVALKVTLGIGGTVENTAAFDNLPAVGPLYLSREDDLELTYGLAGQYMVPLHRYFALGGQLGFLTWRSQPLDSNADIARNVAFDLAVVPQGRVQVATGFELYLAIPIGVTLNLLNQADRTDATRSLRFEGNAGIGFTIAAMLGARLGITPGFGAFAEIGYAYRTIGHNVTVYFGDSEIGNVDLDVSLGQFAVNLGVFF